eukprot:1898415-Prymnesium_polylepis.1
MRPVRAPGRAGGRPARQQGMAIMMAMAYDAPGGGVGRYARPAVPRGHGPKRFTGVIFTVGWCSLAAFTTHV